MATLPEAVTDFLAQRRIAVAGVSREPASHGGNIVYKRLRELGYQVFAVNENADEIEGDAGYRSLAAIPGGVDAVVVATSPANAERVVAECEQLGIRRVWMHRSFGGGSVSEAAAQAGRRAGMTVISGGCPLMFDPTADFGHKCMRWALGLTGGAPTAG
jgi:predicted CoA-binding protein